jgi:hypothetical protein
VWLRTSALRVAASCSVTCCIWARSIPPGPWCGGKAIEVLDEDAGHSRTMALFAEDRCAAVPLWYPTRPSSSFACRRCGYVGRGNGAPCWVAGQLWEALQMGQFWAAHLPPSRKGTQWDQVLQVLVAYRLIAPGSEWKLHRDWFGKSAMADLLGRTSDWQRRISFTPATTICCSTRTRCSRI